MIMFREVNKVSDYSFLSNKELEHKAISDVQSTVSHTTAPSAALKSKNSAKIESYRPIHTSQDRLASFNITPSHYKLYSKPKNDQICDSPLTKSNLEKLETEKPLKTSQLADDIEASPSERGAYRVQNTLAVDIFSPDETKSV